MSDKFFFKDVTLLITHYNRSESLERLLSSCDKQGFHFEDVVVSDDCSNPDHLENVQHLQTRFGFRLITAAKNSGLGNNINKGQAAVKTPYTLYVQEDFVPLADFGTHFRDGLELLRNRPELDIVRFYSYLRYPHLQPLEKGFAEMIYKPWSKSYKKIYLYSDHPHLRRSDFLDKFGKYTEGVSVDRSEYRMCVSFIQQNGKGAFFEDYKGIFKQINPEHEPSTTPRSQLTTSKHPIVKFTRDLYRQLRYNLDLRFLSVNKGYASRGRSRNGSSFSFVKLIQKLFDKFLSAIVKLRYPNAGPEDRPFYKDTYYCQLRQLRYFLKDYILKKPYKEITFNGEFAPELQFALPHAYWHHLNGTLRKTSSSKHTAELYFFSPGHIENDLGRTNDGNYNFDIPRILYSQDYDMSKWARVPLKDHYRNEHFQFEKPILIVANRYNMEWGNPPISFLSIENLDYIFSRLKHNYTVIYNRPSPSNITMDDSEIYDLQEFDWMKEVHPEVILMEDLYRENRADARNFNHLQLQVYANCSHFISTHGGTATFASYFGGLNIIFSRQGPEHHFNCYNTLYPKLSGASIVHVKNDSQLETAVERHLMNPLG